MGTLRSPSTCLPPPHLAYYTPQLCWCVYLAAPGRGGMQYRTVKACVWQAAYWVGVWQAWAAMYCGGRQHSTTQKVGDLDRQIAHTGLPAPRAILPIRTPRSTRTRFIVPLTTGITASAWLDMLASRLFAR